MRLAPQIVIAAAVLGLVSPLVLGWSPASVALGVVVGALSAAIPATVFRRTWKDSYGGWRTGSVAQRARSVEKSATQSLRAAVLLALVVVALLVGFWVDDDRPPSLRAILLFIPALMALVQYRYARWYGQRLRR